MSLTQPNKEFVEGFLDAGQRKFVKSSFTEFLLTKFNIRHDNKIRRYSFEGHAYLKEIAIILEKSQDFRALKAGQVAVSTLLLGESFYRADATALKLAWFFPDKESMKLFVQDRAYEIIESTPHIKKRLDNTDSTLNTSLIKYNDATIAFRSTGTKKGVKTYDADIIYLDEFDEHNAENVVFADDRLLHSKLALRRSASQPSIEDFGIHAEWVSSNQMMYLHKCGSCGHWNNLVESFLEDAISIFGTDSKGKTAYVCRKCSKPINNQKGQYVKKREHANDGVQVSQFFSSIRTPAELLKKWQEANSSIKRKNYYISVVGWPYSTDDEKPITQSVLDSFKGDHGLMDCSGSFTYMGADQGDTVHMVFGEPTLDYRIKITGLVKFSVLDESAILDAIIKFKTYSGIVDAMPNKNWSVRLAKTFPENIRIQYFAKRFSLKPEPMISDDDGIEVVNVNRDESLQETIDKLKDGFFILPDKSRLVGPDLALAEEFDYHLKMLIRERGEDENGKPKYSFKKKVPNHFGMALNSLRLAFELGAV